MKFKFFGTVLCLRLIGLVKAFPLSVEENGQYPLRQQAIIKGVSALINAEMHVYVNLFETAKGDSMDWLLRLDGDVSHLIITAETKDTNFMIFRKFTSKSLLIAFVDETNMLEVRGMVNRLLWRLHYRDVLFLFDDMASAGTQEPQHSLVTLFTECWRNGYTQVLALYKDGLLYTYHPFPVVKVVQLRDVAAYRNRSHLLDFQGYRLRSPISNSSPRSYHYIDRNGKQATGGYFYKLVKLFIDHYNGTFEELVMPTYELNMDDILAAFEAHQIEIVANLLYDNRRFSHSRVVCIYNVYIMAPFARPIPAYYYFLRPFTTCVWLLIAAMLAYVTALLTLVYWQERKNLELAATFMEVLKLVLFLPHHRRRIRKRVQFFIFVALLVAGFMLTNSYLAKLSSLLTKQIYGPQITTFDDIEGTKFMLPQTPVDRDHLHEISDIHPAIFDHLWVTTPEVVHSLRRDLNTSFLHSGVEDKIKFFLYQQKFLKVPYFRRMQQILYTVPLFIPMPHGSPFLPILNRFLRYAMDSGITKKIIADNEEEGILNGEIRFFPSEMEQLPSLTLTHFLFAFIIMSIGIICANIAFCYEVFRKKKLN